MKAYSRQAVRSEHRSEVASILANLYLLRYDRWFIGLTVTQRRFVRDLSDVSAYGPSPDYTPLPEEIE
jgi:hypothetical protein